MPTNLHPSLIKIIIDADYNSGRLQFLFLDLVKY